MKPSTPRTEIKPLPDLEPIHVRIAEAEAAEEENKFFGSDMGNGKTDERKTVWRVKVVMDVLDDEFDGSRVWFWGSFSVGAKAMFRKLVIAASGLPTNASISEIQDAADTDTLVGKELIVLGEIQETGYLKPTAFKAVKRTATRAKAVTGVAVVEDDPYADEESDLDI